MALDKNTKLAIKAKIKLGTQPKEVAEQFSVNIQTVYGIAREVRDERENDIIAKVMAIPEETITHIVEEAKKDLPLPTPTQPSPMAEGFDRAITGIDGLKKLDMSFQTTMTNVLGRFDALLQDKEMPLKDIIQISSNVANAYEKVFSSGTNIHIGDNNSHSTQQLSVFQNKKGV